jgi:stage V sporulation protein G
LTTSLEMGGEIDLEVTEVRLRRVYPEGRMRAIVSITIDGEFVVHDIRVIDGKKGMFVAMPSKRTPDGEFRDIAHPISPVMREKIEAAVLEAYRKASEDLVREPAQGIL